jgi:hypothetical protein
MEQMPPQLCLSLLKSSVRDVSKLRQVNTTANLDLAKGGSPFNFENYLSLLLASVTLYDKGNNLSNSCSPKNKRSAFVAETIFPNDDYGIDYNIDYLRPFCTKRVRTTVEQETKIKTARAMSTVNNRIFPVKCGINCLMMQRRSLEACLLPRKVKPHLTASQHPRFHANSHSLTDMGHPFPSDNSLNESNKDKFHDCGNNTELLAHLTDRLSPMANGDIRKVLASASSHKQKQNVKNSLQSNMLKYSISRHSVVGTKSSLIDRGANGGLAGTDVKVINKTGRLASIIGVNGHSLSDLDIVTAAGLVESQNGPIIVKLHQYAHHGKGKTIHSSAQLEYYKNTVKDRSCVFGGKQRIVTLDDYVIPLHVRQGLAYMDMRPPLTQSLIHFPTLYLLPMLIGTHPSLTMRLTLPRIGMTPFRISRPTHMSNLVSI